MKVKVKPFSYKRNGKTIKVKAYTYNSKYAKGLTKNRKKLTPAQKKKRTATARARRRRLKV